ncbi:MAG: peptidylprolyl isomerase [Chitinophagales bacterium]|jgi:cyclophilin family peptidyl-prolyl cis-trans isomerase|nr:peptidylprolyl isomerase [Sphingobacteriales bacterium]
MRWLAVFIVLFFSLHAKAQTYIAKIKTTEGNITVMLYDSTPKHRDNFIKLCNEKFYDSLLFHRVIKGFVAQGGDPVSKKCSDTFTLGDGDLGYTIPAEFVPSYFHKRGAFAQARDDRPDMASSACQFYIVQGKIANDSIMNKAFSRNKYKQPAHHEKLYRTIGGIPHLDMRYTVYGEVISGMNVVDKICSLPTNGKDRPLRNVRIKTIIIKKQ